MPLLEIRGVTKKFYEFTALDEVSLTVDAGEIVGIIGPNGSGKTTLFNCITGLLPTTAGQVFHQGKCITGVQPFDIARRGLSRTFQAVRLFDEMTVLDNLLVTAQRHQGNEVLRSILRMPSAKRLDAEARSEGTELLRFVGIDRFKNEKAGNLSYGQKKLLTFCMALIGQPSLVLLDEPAAAVNPTLISELMKYIRDLNERGVTFLLVEHNMDFVMSLSTRVIALDHGQKIAEGLPREIQCDARVLESYFG